MDRFNCFLTIVDSCCLLWMRCFGSNGLMISFDTFLFMLLPCLGLSSPPPTLILKLGGCFLGLPKPQNKKCSEMVDFVLNPLLKNKFRRFQRVPRISPLHPQIITPLRMSAVHRPHPPKKQQPGPQNTKSNGNSIPDLKRKLQQY